MLPYSSLYTRAGDNSLLRVLGGVLALLSIVLALLGIIFHQGVADLVIGVIVGIFALRVLILWLGDKVQAPQHGALQKPYANSVRYPTRTSSQTLRYAGQPTQYAAPYAETSSFYQEGTQVISPPMPVPPVVPPTQPAPTPPKLPRSIRPQRPPVSEAPFPTRFIEPAQPVRSVQPVEPMQPIQPMQPVQSVEPVQLPHVEQQGEVQQPLSEWLTPADAPIPVLLPAPKPLPNTTVHWQYDDGSDFSPSGREEVSDDGTA